MHGDWMQTDTASVLQEAALSIKFLHEQIKVRIESAMKLTYYFIVSFFEFVCHICLQVHAESSSSSGDLRNRGLCLVPIYTVLGLDLVDQIPCGGGAWPDPANY